MANLSHENIFTQSYARLRSWAIQITGQDYSLAEDLLHDAFIQFTRTQPDLDNIQNLDGYLYGVIRNLYHSYLRKNLRRNTHQLSIIDFETIRLGLIEINNAHAEFQIQEELKRICYYVCLRKESSRAASVMILRFFHGYFPSEIAEVLQTTPQAVKVRLRLARIEAKTALENPQAVKIIADKLSQKLTLTETVRSNADLAIGLGEMIFRSRTGNCRENEDLTFLYRKKTPAEPIDTETLAHIVSCRTCLDKVNSLLGLLPISERYSIDFIGKNNGNHDGDNGSNNSSGGGNMSSEINNRIRQNWQRGAQEVFEHEPRELFVSINGAVKASQKIEKNHNEQSVSVDAVEPLEYIEIFSEQNVRLAFVSLDEFSFDDQTALVNLSDNRALSLTLSRASDSEIKLNVVYTDPTFEETERLLAEELAAARKTFTEFLPADAAPKNEKPLFTELLASGKTGGFAARLKNKLFPAGFGLNPATAFLAVFVISALVLGRFLFFVPSVSAGEILDRAASGEEANASLNGTVFYRTINLEERKPGAPDGEILSRKKIEIRTDAARKLVVRRLYDEKDRLIAGEWRRTADGVSTFYVPGDLPELRPAPVDKELTNGNLEDIWQLTLSARGFKSLVNEPEKTQLEERDGDFVINYQTDKNQGLVKAALVVDGDEMRASRQILVIRKDNTEREFRFIETVFEKKSSEMVEKSVFEPERELTGAQTTITASTVNNSGNGNNESQSNNLAESTGSLENQSNATAAGLATPELELKVLQLLNSVNALSGDQINITKTPDGKLRINGIIDSKSRKDEILNSLAELRGNSALSINILTAEEAAKGKSGSGKRDAATDELVENIEIETKTSIPAGDALRDHFLNSGTSPDRIESELRRYSSAVLSKSSQMRRAALSMKQIAERFSPADLEKMDEKARGDWRRLLRQNAANLLRQSESLRNELRPVFQVGGGGASGGSVNSSNDADLIRAARRLFDLSLTVDKDVRASFSVSTAGSSNVPVKSGRFDSSLAEIINLSRQF